jgi:hypothetical protein
MSDDELARGVIASLEPVLELLTRMQTILERLTDRVEVLELELLHQAPDPTAAPDPVPAGAGETRA